MAASPRDRRAAVWPWLVMPLIVLLVFLALLRVHHGAGSAMAPAEPPAADGTPKP